MRMLIPADNRSQTTVHSPLPTYLDFKPHFTWLKLTRRVIKLDFLFFKQVGWYFDLIYVETSSRCVTLRRL